MVEGALGLAEHGGWCKEHQASTVIKGGAVRGAGSGGGRPGNGGKILGRDAKPWVEGLQKETGLGVRRGSE